MRYFQIRLYKVQGYYKDDKTQDFYYRLMATEMKQSQALAGG